MTSFCKDASLFDKDGKPKRKDNINESSSLIQIAFQVLIHFK